MKRLVFPLGFALGPAAFVLGCHDDDSGSGYVQSCERNCERWHQCLSTVDTKLCATSCTGRLSAYGDQLRSDYVALVDDCVADLSCSQLDDAALTDTCPAEARMSITSTPEAIALCQAIAMSYQECDVGVSVVIAGCVESYKIFSKAALRSANGCLTEPCKNRMSCVKDKLGRLFYGG